MQADEPTVIGEPPIETYPAGADPAMRWPTSDWQRVLQTTIQTFLKADAAKTERRLLAGVTVAKDAAPEDETVLVNIKAGPPYIEKDSHPGFQYTSADAEADRARARAMLRGQSPHEQRCDFERCCDCGAVMRADRRHAIVVERVVKYGDLRRYIEVSAKDTCAKCLLKLTEPIANKTDIEGLIEPPVYGGPPKSKLTLQQVSELVDGTIDRLCFADGPRKLTGIEGLLEAEGRESAPVDPVASFFGEFKP